MNYMKQVAKLLYVEIGEEFKIEGHSGNVKYRLTEENLEYFSGGKGFTISSTLNCLLNGEYKVVKIPKPILDDVEKRYLSRVIRPWRDKVTYVVKRPYDSKQEYIIVAYYEDSGICIKMPFPCFKKGTMYKDIELYKQYTIEELGLWKI